MHRFCLILATIGRTIEVEQFLSSLSAQTFQNFMLIVVDQNEDDRLLPILARWQPVRLTHVRSQPGLSRARNIGLSQAKGEILAFPDDDCTYPPDTLANVDRWFRSRGEFDILTLGSRDASGVRSGNKWFAGRCRLTQLNIFRTSQSYTFFVRNTLQVQAITFDETLGVGAGTPFGSGEDTDFLLQAMKHGVRGHFFAGWHIVHPCKDVQHGGISSERFYRYGLGMGRVQRKHTLFWLWLLFLAYDLARAGSVGCLGRTRQARLWFAHSRGLVRAYLS